MVAGYLAQRRDEVLVVCDDDEHKVRLTLALLHDAVQRIAQRGYIDAIQVRGGLIQGQHTAITAKRLGQCQAYNQGGQDALTSTAASPHLYLSVILRLNHSVVVGLSAIRRSIRADLVCLHLNVVNVITAVYHPPVLAYQPVNLLHLLRMELN